MDIIYSELNNNQNPYQNIDYNSNIEVNPESYWEKSQTQSNNSKKKKVSFNEILSNMNIVVNEQGVLQFMQPSHALKEQIYPQYQDTQQQPYQEYVAKQVEKNQKQPLDPSVKNSFLYNKYFKDYKDVTNVQPEIRVPKTIEEYKQMLLDDKIKRIEQKKRISQIKSTKLLFTTNADSQGVIRPTKNNLRNMSFF
jgi:hypothetical protein